MTSLRIEGWNADRQGSKRAGSTEEVSGNTVAGAVRAGKGSLRSRAEPAPLPARSVARRRQGAHLSQEEAPRCLTGLAFS